jgi:serine/threonine protein kinase/Tfp pilus assembly protein PilF
MTELQKCPRCGAVLPKGAPSGQCMHCLLQLGLGGFENPEPPPASGGRESNRPPQGATAEKPGDQIDRFRLIRPVGEGGFGVVFEAEQETPVRRKVALKVIKLGMDTRQVVARFEAERQALALMEHPNIARVLEGGMTAAGRPYFVMEFVNGIRITDYCDQHQLSLRARLDLFIEVCEAIQHAHQKGIIHRDIKPSNILVTDQDGVPVPKVIDFGIAKAAFDPASEGHPYETTHQVFAGTPAYMSPEQAGMDGFDVDARSDIYSLGMLLYELLTARPAFRWDELSHAALNEILRVIRESEPARPSTQLTSLAPQELTVIARCRRAEPGRLPSLLRGDLDWVVMKAIEKDRNRRYETANGLALDIRRHLDHQPVLARPPNPLYLLGKTVRRNRLACAAAALVTIALVAGLGLASWMYVREKQAWLKETQARLRAEAAEKKAANEAATSFQTAQFLKQMLEGVGPSVALGRDTVLLREILDKTSERIGKQLTNQPAVEADLRNTLGDVYQTLGDYPKAEAELRAAIDLNHVAPGKEDIRLAATLNNLGIVLQRRGDLSEAEASHRRALAIQQRMLGPEHREIAKTLGLVGNALFLQARLADAEPFYRKSLALSQKTAGKESQEAMTALGNLGNLLGREGKVSESESILKELLALQKKLLTDKHPLVAKTLTNLGMTFENEDKPAEAEAAFREAVALRRKILPPDHPDLAFTLQRLGTLLNLQGRQAEAEPVIREALDIRRKKLGAQHPDLAVSLFEFGQAVRGLHRPGEAEGCFREALDIIRQNPGDQTVTEVSIMVVLGSTLMDEQKWAEAEGMLSGAATTLKRQTSGRPSSELAAILGDLALAQTREDKLLEAETTWRDLLACRRELLAREAPPTAEAYRNLLIALDSVAQSLMEQNKFAEAEPLAREGLKIGEANLSADWQACALRSTLGGCLLGQEKFAEAEPVLLQAVEGLERQKGGLSDPGILTTAMERVVRLFKLTNRAKQAAEWAGKLPTAK